MWHPTCIKLYVKFILHIIKMCINCKIVGILTRRRREKKGFIQTCACSAFLLHHF